MKHFRISLLAAAMVAGLSSCESTSLSNPAGSGHGGDLSLYELAGIDPRKEVTESDIQRLRGGRVGALPSKGARILLVQSGAHQPDEDLRKAYASFCDPVPWDGRSVEPISRGDGSASVKSPGSAGRRLRLVAAQQNCSHVVVVFGEIQSASETLPTDSLMGWVPLVGDVVPSSRSGHRLMAQAIVLETGAPRYQLVSADSKEAKGLVTNGGEAAAAVRRSDRMKKLAYPELAERTFRS